MANRHFSTEEVLALLVPDEELDDPEEVLVEGSDEEFVDLEELDEIEMEDLEEWEDMQGNESGITY